LRSSTERDLVLALRDVLRSRYDWITAHRKPSASPHLRKALTDQLGYIPILQPEIDLAFADHDSRVFAVEVKAFTAVQASFRLPFYEGIGQALALHRYGFDCVALWFVFLGTTLTSGIRQYGAQAWHFLRNELCLPIDFTFFMVNQDNSAWRFRVLQYTGVANARPLLELNDPRFRIIFRHPNPLLTPDSLPSRIRQALVPWLQNGA